MRRSLSFRFLIGSLFEESSRPIYATKRLIERKQCRRSTDNLFREIEEIELAVKTIRSKVVNHLNINVKNLLAFKRGMDTFKRFFVGQVIIIHIMRSRNQSKQVVPKRSTI